MAAVGGIEELGQAGGAGGRFGGDRRVGLAAVGALEDAEAALPGGRQPRPGDRLDAGQRRCFRRQPGHEALDGLALALDVEQHAALVVEHVAGEPLLAGQPVDVGAKADALDHALHAPRRAPRHDSTSSRSTW